MKSTTLWSRLVNKPVKIPSKWRKFANKPKKGQILEYSKKLFKTIIILKNLWKFLWNPIILSTLGWISWSTPTLSIQSTSTVFCCLVAAHTRPNSHWRWLKDQEDFFYLWVSLMTITSQKTVCLQIRFILITEWWEFRLIRGWYVNGATNFIFEKSYVVVVVSSSCDVDSTFLSIFKDAGDPNAKDHF